MIRLIKVTAMLVLILAPASIFSQKMNQKMIDPKKGEEILIGYCTRGGLEKGSFGKSFAEYYKIYQPDSMVVMELAKKQDDIEIMIVLGTWCSDSQEQVPKFFKVLDLIRFPKSNVQIICVDSSKKSGDIDLVNYNIEKVPTFMVYRKGREIGRIIETPYSTIEKDLLMFFSDY